MTSSWTDALLVGAATGGTAIAWWPSDGQRASGTSVRHRSNTCGQRGWKAQPGGTRSATAGSPRIGRSRSSASLSSSRGIELSSPHVYGWCGAVVDVVDGRPTSTILPAYITRMWSQCSATTPRSWVIDHDRRVELAPSAGRCRSRICAWTVTSSAVVGSSAISRSGFSDERHRDHRPLAHAAGELVRVLVGALVAGEGCRPGRASRPPARAPPASETFWWTRTASAIWSPTL